MVDRTWTLTQQQAPCEANSEHELGIRTLLRLFPTFAMNYCFSHLVAASFPLKLALEAASVSRKIESSE